MATTFFIQDTEKTFGPFTKDQVRELASRGKLKASHKISADRKHWTPADQVKGLDLSERHGEPPAPAQSSTEPPVTTAVQRQGLLSSIRDRLAGATQEGLFTAVNLGDIRKLIEILKRKPDLANVRDKNSQSPLHRLPAATPAAVDIANIFLQHGADVKATDPDGNTPLHIAVMGIHPDACKALIAAGADVNAHNAAGNTPLHNVAGWGIPSNIPLRPHAQPAREAMQVVSIKNIELLLDHGAEPHPKNNEGATPADVARKMQLDDVVSAIAQYTG